MRHIYAQRLALAVTALLVAAAAGFAYYVNL